MTLDMTQFHQVFFDETAEFLATMESLLLHLDAQDPDPEQLEDLSRAAHSIKGSSGTFGYRDMAGLAQQIEALVARLRRGEERLTAERIQALREACGALRALLAGHRDESGQAQAGAALRSRPRERARGGQPDGKVSPRSTANRQAGAAGTLQALARRTTASTNQAMDLVEAGSDGLAEVTEAVRALGEAIEQNAALVEQAAERAEALRDAFRALVLTIAGMALSSPGKRAASDRHARPRPLPKVRRAVGGADNGREWPE